MTRRARARIRNPGNHRDANGMRDFNLYDGVTEREWLATVLDIAERRGWLAYHTWKSENSPAGFPDVVAVRDRIIFAELKTEIGRVSPAQNEWGERIRGAGVEWYVWRPHDVNAVHQVFA